MADNERDEDWGPKTARLTFVATLLGAAAFVGSVIFFILSRKA